MAALTLFDLVLVAGIALVAWVTLIDCRRFRVVVLYVVFGLLLAIAWARLGAVDLALAEAAIGAGITGALFMAALARVRRAGGTQAVAPTGSLLWAAGVALLAAGAVVWVLADWPVPAWPPVAKHLDNSGVDHSVTAVLLAFRAWDTLLEIAVLVAAGFAIHASGPAPAPPGHESGALQLALLRIVNPFLVVLAVYLLWKGGHAPGGAFQAGAMLAAAGIFHHLSHFPAPLDRPSPWQRPAAVVALLLFAFAGAATLGTVPLAWPEGWAKVWILTIEAAATLSIGLLLTQLFVGGRPRSPGDNEEKT
ncbi:MAG: hydrogenase subunit MbhD domain-containing protein [Pseudomonadota bacterium]